MQFLAQLQEEGMRCQWMAFIMAGESSLWTRDRLAPEHLLWSFEGNASILREFPAMRQRVIWYDASWRAEDQPHFLTRKGQAHAEAQSASTYRSLSAPLLMSLGRPAASPTKKLALLSANRPIR
jgi:hypothetical protein